MFEIPSDSTTKPKRFVYGTAASALIILIGIGILARNNWFPTGPDPISGKRTGWFGKPIAKNAPSSWNPLAMPTASPTPQLSKELIYAGSRLIAVQDANATAAPPADLAVWRPSSGIWYVLGGPGSAQTSFQFGSSADTPVPGDFDGDGKTDFAVFRDSNGTWYATRSSDGDGSWYGYSFGQSGDIPVAADFDGDGKSDVAVFRRDTSAHTGTWHYIRSSDSGFVSIQYGLDTDFPAPADFDGDGKADITVWRSSDATFYTRRSSDAGNQSAAISFTGYSITSSDQAVSADYDGDGRANYAIRNGSTWLMLDSSLANMTPVTPSGDSASDVPVPNDYDGDGKCDVAVWRNSNGDWYIRKSGSGNALRQEQWGTSGDKPVPAYFRR